MSEFKYLFSPLKIGATVVPNRIHFAAHMTNYAVDNLISDRHIYYYRRAGQRRRRFDHNGGDGDPSHGPPL